MKKMLLAFCSILLFSCNQKTMDTEKQKAVSLDFTQYANPFIGTGKMGHTFPGAVLPFGAVQVSPVNFGKRDWHHSYIINLLFLFVYF